MRYLLAVTASFALLANAPSVATAGGNLVVNGDFGTGDLSGWNVHDPSGGILVDQGLTPSGTLGYFASFSSYASGDSLSQLLATTPGTTYTFDFFVAPFVISQGFGLNVTWDNAPVAQISGPYSGPAFVWTEYTAQVTATGSSSTIAFTTTGNSLGDTSTFYIDDVSVTASAAVPEPSSLVLLGVGVAGSVLYLRRRRRRA